MKGIKINSAHHDANPFGVQHNPARSFSFCLLCGMLPQPTNHPMPTPPQPRRLTQCPSNTLTQHPHPNCTPYAVQMPHPAPITPFPVQTAPAQRPMPRSAHSSAYDHYSFCSHYLSHANLYPPKSSRNAYTYTTTPSRPPDSIPTLHPNNTFYWTGAQNRWQPYKEVYGWWLLPALSLLVLLLFSGHLRHMVLS